MSAREGQRPESGGGGPPGELVLVALGGLGEIGMNAYLYGVGPARTRRWLLVDLGITFPEGEFDPGVDVILPDPTFLEEEAKRLDGIVITHAHEDHIGAVLELWGRVQAPIYATPFTAGMLKAKQAEYASRTKIPLNVVPLDSAFKVGAFDLELVSMTHSIPETSGLVLRTRHGTVFHTGDWKFDTAPMIGAPTNEDRLAALGSEGVDVLVCDSTNVFREGNSPSEKDVAVELSRLIKEARGRVAVTTFASNIGRIRAVADAARAAGRHLVVAGRALHRAIAVAIETGYLPEGFRYLDDDQAQYLDRRDAVILVTGSQGEPRAALARISERSHPRIQLTAGDTVIFSSRTIPGNEREVGRVQNGLAAMGCRLITDNEALVHVTGHPRREELKKMYALMKPRVAVPMHGEVRHLLEHARLAKSCGVSEIMPIVNGQVLRLSPGEAKIIDKVRVGRIYRDGRILVPADEGPVRERRKLAFVGVIAVSLVLSKRGELVAAPQIAIDGVPHVATEARSMDDLVRDTVRGTIESIPLPRRKDGEMVRDAIRRSVRAAVEQIWGKKPIVKVLLTQLDIPPAA